MDRQTLANYGWVVIVTLVLAVMLGLATPFGKYIDNAVQNTIHAYGKAEDDALKNVDAMQSEWDEMLDLPTSHNTTIPSGAVYYSEVGVSDTGDYTNATAIYKKGDEFPELQNGDVYVYGDYEYRYNAVPYTINIYEVGWKEDSTLNGWSVRVLNDEKETYGIILDGINNAPVVSLDCAFYSCDKLKQSPRLPSKALYMQHTFRYCENLTTPPILPQGVTTLENAFQACEKLEKTPVFPNSIKTLRSTFWGCPSLKTIETLPNSVTNCSYAFYDCDSIKTAPIFPEGVTNLTGAFYYCDNLKTVPYIPTTVTNMTMTFASCISLTDVAALPENNCSFTGTFSNCTSLITIKYIPCTHGSVKSMFKNCSSLLLPPELKHTANCNNFSAAENIEEMFMGCVSLSRGFEQPNATNLTSTYEGCISLSGEIKINGFSTQTTLQCENCFKDTVLPINITGNLKNELKALIASTANNNNVTY